MLRILSHTRSRRRQPESPWWLRRRPPLYLGGVRDCYLDYEACDADVVIDVYLIGEEPALQSRVDTGYSELHAGQAPDVVLATA